MKRLFAAALAVLLVTAPALAGTWTERDNADGPLATGNVSGWTSTGTSLYVRTNDVNDAKIYITSGGAWSNINAPDEGGAGTSRMQDVYYDGTSLIAMGTDKATTEVATFYSTAVSPVSWSAARTLAANGRIRGALKLGSSWYFTTASDGNNIFRVLTTSSLGSNPTSHSDISTNGNVLSTQSDFVAVATNFNLAANGHATDGLVEFRGYNDSGSALFTTQVHMGTTAESLSIWANDCGSQAVVVVAGTSDSAIFLVNSDGSLTTQKFASVLLRGGVEWDGGCMVPSSTGTVYRLASGTWATVAGYELTGEDGGTKVLATIDGTDLFLVTGIASTGGELWEFTSPTAPTAAVVCEQATIQIDGIAYCSASSTTTGDAASVTYDWTMPAGCTSDSDTAANVVVHCTTAGVKSIRVDATSAFGTDDATDSVTVQECEECEECPECPTCVLGGGSGPIGFGIGPCE